MDKEASIYPLILNQSNLIPSINNNQYRYEFPSTMVFKNAKIALASCNIFYSWQNISSSQFNNNSFQLIFPDFAGTTTYTITLPDGYYSVSDLNSFIQQFCITNDLYLINENGQFIYYIELLENPTFYSVQFNLYKVPTSLPAGWTNPGNNFSFPGISAFPQLIILSNGFKNIVGITPGTYPSNLGGIPGGQTVFSVLSDFTPQVSPVQSAVITCSLLNNKFSNPNTILYSFSTENTPYGGLIQTSPNEYYFTDIQDGSYQSFDITFIDQDFNSLKILDSNLIIKILIKST